MAKINWNYDEVVTEQDLNDIGMEINTHQVAIDKLDGKVSEYVVADGANTYTATILGISSLVEGMSVKVKFTNANTGASSLNINSLGAIPILKGNGNLLSAGNIKAGQIMHLVYDGVNFSPLGEGGEYGTAVAGDVLVGKTIGAESGIITGTMPDRGTINNSITTQGGSYTIPNGRHSGSGKITANITNLIAANIRKGINVGGVLGTHSDFGNPNFNLTGSTFGMSASKTTSTSDNDGTVYYTAKINMSGVFNIYTSTQQRTNSNDQTFRLIFYINNREVSRREESGIRSGYQFFDHSYVAQLNAGDEIKVSYYCNVTHKANPISISTKYKAPEPFKLS